MPISKDETGKRWVEMDFLVPGTPEKVWQAVATGPGNAAWFAKGEIEPRVGGSFSLDVGQGTTTSGEVTVWDPPHKFGYVERDWDEGAPPLATEITITGRSDDECGVRMVHALFTPSEDWDDQLEGFESAWPGFFVILRVYLAHFAGMRAASFIINAPARKESLATWQLLGESLGLAGANVGESRTTSVGHEPWSGVVEHVYQDTQQRYVILRLDAPSPGAALVGTYETGTGSNVSLCRYFYGDDAAILASESELGWREWLTGTFAEDAAEGRPEASIAKD